MTLKLTTVNSEQSSVNNDETEETATKIPTWKLDYYVDDFKEATDEWYIRNEEPFEGTFDNSATSDSELSVVMLIDEKVLSIMLYEYGNSPVKNQFFNQPLNYKIKMRSSDDTDYETSGFMYEDGDRIFIESPGKDVIINALQKDSELKFSIEDMMDNFTHYVFTVQTSNFSEIYAASS